jgi:hypothetical protein
MSNFDWIKARAACSAARVFEQLRLQIETDIQQRNDMLQGAAHSFQMVSEGNKFKIFVSPSLAVPVAHQSIRFQLEGQQIVATDAASATVFTATLTLNDQGQCRLNINARLYELWQVRHMALEKLFFDLA